MSERTNYCNAIAALFDEGRKIPFAYGRHGPHEWAYQHHAPHHSPAGRRTADAGGQSVCRAQWLAAYDEDFSIKTLARGAAHAERGEWPICRDPNRREFDSLRFRSLAAATN
jgi:hypothetical protein